MSIAIRTGRRGVLHGAILIAASVLLLSGCHGFSEVCAGVGQGGIRLSTIDGVTGQPLDPHATVTVTRLRPLPTIARTGTYSPAGSDNPLDLTRTYEGTFLIEVRVPGYVRWTKEIDYFVAECQTDTYVLDVEVRLTPES